MKVAKKSPRRTGDKTRLARATITLAAETHRRIEELRGEQSLSAWIDKLVEEEQQRRERERLAQKLARQYTTAVVRQTLLLNKEFPMHEK